MDRDAFQRYFKDPDAFIDYVKEEIASGFEPLLTQLQAAKVPPVPDPKPDQAPNLDMGRLFMGDAPVSASIRTPATPHSQPIARRSPQPVRSVDAPLPKGVLTPDVSAAVPTGQPVSQTQSIASRSIEGAQMGVTPSHTKLPSQPIDAAPAPVTDAPPVTPPLNVQDISDSQTRLRQREKRLTDMIQKDRGEVL